MSGNNGNNNRLEKKAKMGWAAFFKGQNDNHDSQLRWVSRFNDLKDKLSKNIKFSSCGHKYCAGCLAKLKSQTSSTCAMCRRKIY